MAKNNKSLFGDISQAIPSVRKTQVKFKEKFKICRETMSMSSKAELRYKRAVDWRQVDVLYVLCFTY